ncbi:prenyltransferase/squalene oxidase repeat-containing protein [Micromonospora sp. B11E3]|uniref:prenyltransferase/squalene oxidase repeat-containing protein n=1 Tax=Micromonospora sp. B11E3 TaxID=3153562 RepID=UPI00325EBF95
MTLVGQRATVADASIGDRSGRDEVPVPGGDRSGRDPTSDARELVAAMTREPAGQASPSVYETGRLVSLAPWLTHHVERVEYLLAAQRPDGAWGGPEGYAVVPTLSAVEALLTALRRGDTAWLPGARGPACLVRAVDAGLSALYGRLPGWAALPDLPATDLTVPALVEAVNGHLDVLRADPGGGLAGWRDARPLPLPTGLDGARLDRVRALFAAGRPLPQKLLHALEVGGAAARRVPGAAPTGPGVVGASPAATAAWLGVPEPGAGSGVAAAVSYLEEAARRQGGPVPCATPITVFERAWTLSILSRAGLAPPVSPLLLAGLVAAVGPTGAATGPGLPADADTTSVTLYALARLGHPVDPSTLWRYDTGEHFCTWQGEDGESVTTNAHVLDAFGWHLAHGGRPDRRLEAATRRLSRWLADRQSPDGGWSDRWHASPYYATSCAVLALAGYGRGPQVAGTVARAAAWVLAGQRADGSWGRWDGTVEETAYAVQVLHAAGPAAPPGTGPALARARRYLSVMEGRDGEPALWHDKDLYRPAVIVGAAVAAARHLVRDRAVRAADDAESRTGPLISAA